MDKKKSPRNKTICTPIHEGKVYLDRCIKLDRPVREISEVLDRTILGDSFEICGMLPPESADLIIADPPYNLRKAYNGNVFAKRNEAEYEDYTRRWLSRVCPLLKPQGSIYICCDWETSMVIGRVAGEFFRIRNRITWQREKGRGAAANWKNGMEDIWFATKGDRYVFNLDSVRIRRRVIAPYRENGKPKDWAETTRGNYRDTCPSNFWDDITIPFWSMSENTSHPTQKPEKLIARMILASSNPGDLVLDPFLGSGTTSVTAKKLGRHYVGIEKEAQYCLWAEERLEMAERNKEIQGYSDGVFWERNTGGEQKTRKKGQSDQGTE